MNLFTRLVEALEKQNTIAQQIRHSVELNREGQITLGQIRYLLDQHAYALAVSVGQAEYTAFQKRIEFLQEKKRLGHKLTNAEIGDIETFSSILQRKYANADRQKEDKKKESGEQEALRKAFNKERGDAC